MDKGVLTIVICAAAAAGGLAWQALAPTPPGEALAYAGLAGLIGSLTNRMAIHALFHRWPHRRYALAYTGLIERNRVRIVEAIADAVANEIITPETLSTWMQETDFLEGLRHATAEQVRTLSDTTGPGASLRRRAAAVLQRRMDELLTSERFYSTIRDLVQEKAGLAGQFGHWSGLADYDYVATRVVDAVRERMREMLSEPAGLPSREVQTLIPAVASRLEQWDVQNSPAVEHLIAVLVEKIDVREIVTHSLGRFTPEQVRALVQEMSRRHLAWLEVYGGIFGAVGGGIMWLLV